MPVSQIIGMVGEPRFREMERDAVKAAQARDPCVIVPAVGGRHSRASWTGPSKRAWSFTCDACPNRLETL